MRINESRDLDIYKKLVMILSDFVDKYPGTGMGKVYRQVLNAGLKVMPKDEKALDILGYVIKDGGPKAVQDLMNRTFCELPITIRPVYKDGNAKRTAFWSKDSKIYDKVRDLLDLNGSGVKGEWSDEKSNKVTLLSLDI
jgi:hypothetical protein